MRYFSTRHPVRLLSAATMFALAGCKTFTPDGGMSPVAELAGDTLRKDVVAIRNEGVAVAAYADVQRLLRKTADRGRRGADRAAEQSRPAGRLQRARHRGGARGRRKPAAQSGLFARAALRAGRDRNRKAHRRQHPGARDAAGARRNRGGSLSARRNSRRRKKRCASRPKRGAHTIARLRRTRSRTFSREAQAAAQTRGAACAAARRDRRAEQARSGARAGVLRRYHGAARDVAPARRKRARTLDAAAWDCGATISISGCRAHWPPLPPRPRSLAYVETEAVRRRVDLQIARIEVDTLAKSYGLTQATRFVNLLDRRGQVSHDKSRETAPRTSATAAARSRIPGAAVRFRRSARARGRAHLHARGQPPDRQGGHRALASARRLSQLSRRATTSRRITSARCCRCARSSRTKRCCATTPCRSTCSRCSRRRASALPQPPAAIDAQRDFWLADDQSHHRRCRRRQRASD